MNNDDENQLVDDYDNKVVNDNVAERHTNSEMGNENCGDVDEVKLQNVDIATNDGLNYSSDVDSVESMLYGGGNLFEKDITMESIEFKIGMTFVRRFVMRKRQLSFMKLGMVGNWKRLRIIRIVLELGVTINQNVIGRWWLQGKLIQIFSW